MFRTKKEVDKYVDNLISKTSSKEFKTRAAAIARMYYDVGDYVSCQRYIEQNLAVKDNNAAGHRLLGQALQKMGQKEKALEHYKMSLDIDPTQPNTILDICQLLADDDMSIDPGRARYWCEKAEATFPRHPITFSLREKLLKLTNPDPEAYVKLLLAELSARPKDVLLHCRLLKHYLHVNQIKEAFEHSCNIEFASHNFINNNIWYDTLTDILRHNSLNPKDWLYQLLLLTVRERVCTLSLTEVPNGSSKSLLECSELLHSYDQSLELISKTGAPSGFGEFHSALLQHHRGQLALHSAIYLLKKAKKDQMSWREATATAAPLILIAWQTVPLDPKVNWVLHAPEKQRVSVQRWYKEGTYRCSQAGHYLLSNIQDKNQSFLDKVSQTCSGTHWRDKIYEKIFISQAQMAKIKSSHLASDSYSAPVLRLPRKTEVESYDVDAQREYPNSLHHFIWMLLNYKNFAQFKCALFDMLTPTATHSGPETLNKLDIEAFLYLATLTSRQHKSNVTNYVVSDKPNVLPANITDLLCTLPQMKWWDCAHKYSQNELGTELTDIRKTLSGGMEVVRCIDNHGLDPEILCLVGRIFSDRAKLTTSANEKSKLEMRAGLYYSSALPLLEKLKSKMLLKIPEKRMFDYTHKELNSKELNSLLEESKLYVAHNYLNDCEYDKVIELLSSLKSPEAYYNLGQAYRKLALEEDNTAKDNHSIDKSKYAALMMKAKHFAYKALDKVKDTELNKNHHLYTEVQQLIEDIEIQINKIDPDLSGINDIDGKYSSDENVSSAGSEHVQNRNNNIMFRNLSSTPKQPSNSNLTHYRTAVDTQILETTRMDTQFFEKIEHQIKNFQKRLADDFMEQTKTWFEDNKRLGNQIMSTIQSDIQNTTDQFKLLKISVDKVKDQIDECRNECKDVGDLKKQVAELKKEVSKLKKASSEQNIDESDLYNLEEDYRNNESSSNFAAQLPFQTPPVMPPFNPRLVPPFPVPPNPYQIYSQSLYNLYNQYSQFSQASVPGAPPLFDPAKLSYAGVYPTSDQMYLDVAHLVPPTVPPTPAMPPMPTVPTMSTIATTTAIVHPTVTAVAASKPAPAVESKESSRALPVNVVITSSDPLPTCTTAPPQVLSVTIPPKHIKGTPHNYQIPMPSVNETSVVSPPIFMNSSFPAPGSKSSPATTASALINWNQSSIFKPSQSNNSNSSAIPVLLNTSPAVDGIFSGTSPNTSLNKSRTLSERSNTSVDNYDPFPDFKPIIPLPAEVKVTTGEEDETAIFCARAKLYRYADKQWKERGIGEIKLLKHKTTRKVRVLMRRDQIHKICANHVILPEMEITPMKNEAKAYFWVANDFADEQVVLEKFCIRFKTADIALQFYETFEKARQESGLISTPPKSENKSKETKVDQSPEKSSQSTPIKSGFGFPAPSLSNKSEFGGFKFSSTPTFKAIEDDAVKSNAKPAETTTSKVNVFSNLSFKTTTTSPFSNLFTTTSSPVTSATPTNVNSLGQKQDTPNKLNNSDNVEEFEPNVEFKPIIPLPALVEQKTGEEDENVLFEYRAKLLRYDAPSKEWKERGLGNIKLLIHKENPQKVRLLMRREQIMKVCCNHALTKEMTFEKMPKMDKAVTWCAKDFSDGELTAETFCLRFKTVQICDEFLLAIKLAQSKMKDESKAAKEEQNAAKQSYPEGFGDKFKPKPGSWRCDSCYTNNLENMLKCACCEDVKPGTKGDDDTKTSAPVAANWGDKFKPKPDSWECSSCLIRNEASVNYCTACNNPKDPNMPKKDTILSAETSAPKFRFGIPIQPTSNDPKTVPSLSGFGDKFKPKEGSWECQQCIVRNDSSAELCICCNSPRDPSSINTTNNNQPNSIFGVTPKFNFGIPAASKLSSSQTNDLKPKTETTSIFDGTGAHKFSFGVPSAVQDTQKNVLSFGNQTSIIFRAPKLTSGSDGPLNISNATNQPVPVKPALLPTPQTKTLGDEDAHTTFGFVFKPKTPPNKGKSPKSPGDESDGNEYASEDEGNHIHFSPVIPLPDKVEVVTGEEDEIELYGHRAKLFRYTDKEWKERGIGIVKILKHKDTGKLRVVMRRERILKICLNHVLSPDITYTNKDDKTWLFAANDFSEGELTLQHFCLRFKTKEIASEFKDVIDKALAGKAVPKKEPEKDNGNDDVVFVGETVATDEEKEKAKVLMLPENFYTYKRKEPCKGCRGCQEDVKSDNKTCSVTIPTASTTSLNSHQTPTRTSFQSPMNSFYGTPANFDKTVDASIFRTPLGSIGSNTNTVSPATPTTETSGKDSTNKENKLTQRNIFAASEQSNIFTTPQSKPANIFAGGDTQNSVSIKGSILAAPKLSTISTPGEENKTPEIKSIFGSVTTKSVFGENKPLFGNGSTAFSTNKVSSNSPTDENTDDKPAVKSIFGGDEQKPVNLFSGVAQGSIFGPGALSNSQLGTFSVFGSNTNSSQEFGTQKSIFENTSNAAAKWSFGSGAEEKVAATPKEEETKLASETVVKESPFKVDNSLSFAALSSGTGTTGFSSEKKPDFKWEGAGQQLFTAAQKAQNDKSKNESGAADESGAGGEEEFDPHYEPIVPLPDKIVVTTGEEDEEKMFGERCKLYRFDEKTKEWKERGVGEMKILYHPERKTYRMLLRREQVHKAVLNMLIFMDLELCPMKNSDRAWSWAGRNFAENPQGEQEMLAVRFKSIDLATAFKDKVTECTRKLQAAAAQAVTEANEGPSTVAPLRLPKHLESSARVDSDLSAKTVQQTAPSNNGSTPSNDAPTKAAEVFKQVQFQEPEEEEAEEEVEEEEYDHYQTDDYEGYYDEEESAAFYECVGEALVQQGDKQASCESAHVQVLFDQDYSSPKILVTDGDTGETLADMLIHTDTEFLISGTTCSWSGKDYTNDPVDTNVTVDFHDPDTALQFYDSCETSKSATYSSTDPES